ncbi:MAG: lyase family protein [Comamonas sp.]
MTTSSLPSTTLRDDFFWLGQINKASAVINTAQGLLDPAAAPSIARGLRRVLAAGDAPGAQRPSLVITFEPLLIAAAGVEATLLHAGRSSQDMLVAVRHAILRDELLGLAQRLQQTSAALVGMARQHADAIVPNYTNGVAAQPNSYGHYLLGHAAGLQRDAQRLQQVYARLNLSPMGTTVLNGTGWPLDREKMAACLGFDGIVDNAYDAAQIHGAEMPVELGNLVGTMALHVGAFIQDVTLQYAQARPWLLLREAAGNTYVSSAMPQKRNPGLLIDTRTKASRALTLASGRTLHAHNIPPGMNDAKVVAENVEVLRCAVDMLAMFARVLDGLELNAARALEELNSDWTASQEVADVLMREHRLPFRVGHHFASEMVTHARRHDIRPSDFAYRDAQAIYARTMGEEMPGGDPALPMSEAAFRAALDPVGIVRNRRTRGGPQPVEMQRMLAAAEADLAAQAQWVQARRRAVEASIAQLDADFDRLAEQAPA